MKKIIELSNITSIPEFYNGMILVYSSNVLLFISEKTGKIVHKISFDNWYPLEVSDGKVLMYRNDLFIYDDELKNFVVYQNSISGGSISIYNNKIIESKYDRATNSVQIILYEEKGNKKLWQNFFSNRRGKCIFGKHLYITDLSLKYIDFIDAESGEVRNTLHFENPPISRFIYYYEDTLIVSLQIRPLEEYILLGLDAMTGEEKWRLKSANNLYIQDSRSGYLYDIGGKQFNIIDPNEGKVLYKGNMSDENKKFNVCPECGILGENGIYFKDNFPHSRIGLINIQTHKIEFVIDLNLPKGVKVTEMSYHNGRLYVQDTNDTLHIFAEE